MFQSVIRALIGLCLLALAFYLVVWVLGALGIVLPPMVLKIFMIILVLVAIGWLWRLFSPHVGGWMP